MSYERIRSITVRGGKVYWRADSNNVFPKDYSERECESLTAILQEQGQAALDLEIFRCYETGCFQGGQNKYTRALEILRHDPGYAAFNWRGEPYDEISDRRKTPAFEALLKRTLAAKPPKDRFIIKKDYFGQTVYLRLATRAKAHWTPERTRAKVFNWAQDAAGLGCCYTNGDAWQVEPQ